MMKKLWIVIGVLAAGIGLALLIFAMDGPRQGRDPMIPEPLSYNDLIEQHSASTTNQTGGTKPVNSTANTNANANSNTNVSIPDTDDDQIDPEPVDTDSLAAINLAVPFQGQAPLGNWQLPYKEACEEASAIMVDFFQRGESLSASTMDSEIIDLVAWEEKNGYTVDVSLLQLQRIVEEYYGYATRIIEPLTVQAIHDALDQGHPVIVPAAGRELGNPYFTPPGPPYHMLVIKGFSKDGRFITNDPGTRRGADYMYDTDVLLSAVRDWDGDSADGPRRGLIMFPK